MIYLSSYSSIKMNFSLKNTQFCANWYIIAKKYDSCFLCKIYTRKFGGVK